MFSCINWCCIKKKKKKGKSLGHGVCNAQYGPDLFFHIVVALIVDEIKVCCLRVHAGLLSSLMLEIL